MNSAALLQLLDLLKQSNYHFTAVTPKTHSRVLSRTVGSVGLRDIFGWNRTFTTADLEPRLLDCLERGTGLERCQHALQSRIRVASIGDDLFLHSAFPTVAKDAVFFGPDTYRFVRFVLAACVRDELEPQLAIDMGAGSGAGAVVLAKLLPRARVVAVDLNPLALELANVNAQAAGVQIETLCSSTIPGAPDLVIANPPYIMDAGERSYRHGGDLLGGRIALEWVKQALDSMSSGGTMLLYTGAAITDGHAPLIDALARLCASRNAQFTFEETDPDVFGEELDEAAYADVERIALVCATIRTR